MTVDIRPAIPADVPAIGRLGAMLVRAHHDFDDRRFIAATAGTERGYGSFPGTQLDALDVVVLAAERDGAVVGCTYAGVEGHDWMALRGPAAGLHDIVVDPAQRGYGIVRKLLDATLEALASRGARQVTEATVTRAS